MIMSHVCEIPRDTGYSNVCQICGVPQDAGYFDVASIKEAPGAGEEVELARYDLHSQYCGTLLYFAQFAEEEGLNRQVISHTPGYEWIILCNNQPRAPDLPTSLILNPWGYNAFPVNFTPSSDLNAGEDGEKAMEQLTLAYEDFREEEPGLAQAKASSSEYA